MVFVVISVSYGFAKAKNMEKDWNPELYLRFEAERTRPAIELLSRIDISNPSVVTDLGCGPGNSAALLARRWPDASVVGVDSSLAMLEKARNLLPSCRFDAADIASWTADKPCDVIFANASLQWVPHHEKLIPRLVSQLAGNGVLAVQMPDNLDEPSHVLMREVAAGSWKEKIGDTSTVRTRLLSADRYYDLLVASGCRRVDMWKTVYFHVMPATESIVEWLKSTGLRPFLEPLNEQEKRDFLWQYLKKLRKAYPERRDGNVLLPFPRFFFVATR